MKLRLGFLGIGAMGISHVRQFHTKLAARSECVAICGRNEANLRRALEVAPSARVFANELELIHSDLDAVCISMPNFNHVPLALESLKAANISSSKSPAASRAPSVACWRKPPRAPTAS